MSLVEKALKKLQASQPAADKSENKARDSSAPPVAMPMRSARRTDAKTIMLDKTQLRVAGLLPQVQQERRVANEYRQIKRPLVAAAVGKSGPVQPNAHLIMVASALSGEGKTFTSMNLALSIALEKDVRVLLVDADVAKPHISSALGLSKDLGLVDLLVDSQLDAESLVLQTDVPGLSVLPAGRSNEIATELLSSERMGHLIAELGQADSRRIVIFDSPPLLLTNESRALVEVAGQIVLVVRANVTTKSAVSDALALIGDNKSVGLVLNQSAPSSLDGYYGYGYGSGGVSA